MHTLIKQGFSVQHCSKFLYHKLFQQQLPQSGSYRLPQYCVYRQARQLLRQLHGRKCFINNSNKFILCSSQRNFISFSDNTCHNPSPGHKLLKPFHNHKAEAQDQRPFNLSQLAAEFGTAQPQDVSSKFSISNPVYAAYLDSLLAEHESLQGGHDSSPDASLSPDSHPQGVLSRQSFLHSAVGVIKKLKAKHQEMSELSDLLNSETDSDMKKMMESELVLYRAQLEDIEEELIDVLVGDDPADNSDIMLEVTAGVGGQEAMLFCLEIFNMYCNYAARKGWQLTEPFSDTSSEQGGARKASVEISGDGVYRQLKHEGGVHRVQRVPKTEKAGRIHTSTITVSVMPVPREIDLDIRQQDLKVETFRNSGPGGQSVNTTDSAVRITHLPTGTVAEGKEERSQMKNRDIAMKKLKQR
ncbi:peptide chain release factor 1 [Elysia marginata]|uniref:Peptide chain release factor 1 n=1 Tax=Elysia marginata TaxID=1093978 RepID=A0AAV4EMQ0_9GAST|nr:peptide chain release factor 1 [Elysia marginata]